MLISLSGGLLNLRLGGRPKTEIDLIYSLPDPKTPSNPPLPASASTATTAAASAAYTSFRLLIASDCYSQTAQHLPQTRQLPSAPIGLWARRANRADGGFGLWAGVRT